ncbi:predicted protein [Chaetomium globosum CBS 148.51]|uniref:GPI anchored serine-threonine rich protein n=1 Tax=Chaetomium globosum (strain ATCC 6205 / CBS 148.51 / DSM 1962 / NBRC 6347 / NRRL 1970) TaxID=306901 RepID=Q2HBK3_CHAGB|nr:uncharacterized protein CHGG_02401 [Chaetomium globosum CBS 148.51]EAQ90466.1 predicted protein [Chaetomium globosum CBS 148.51]
MQKFILLGLLPSLALAGRISSPFVLRRTDGGGGYDEESCEDLGMQDCGGCIPLDYTCCPAQTGGCPPDQRCVVGDDGEDGCCPEGYTCTGNGGVSSTTFSLTTSTSTSAVVEEPSPTPTGGANEETPPDYGEIPGPTLVDPNPEETPTPTPEPTPEPSPEPTSSEEAETTETTSTPTSSPEAESSTTTEDAAESTTTESASASASETASEEATSTTASEDASSTSAAASTISTTTTVAPTLSASSTLSFSNGTFTTASTTAYTTSTVYTTTTRTITSCPPSHPCQSGTVVTETIAVSTTICPVVENPPLPTPTNTPATIINGGDSTTTTVAPVNTPVVVCPGNGQACSPVDNDNNGGDSDNETPSASSSSVATPPSYTHGGAHPTGSVPKPPMTTGHVPVTAGAARVGQAVSGVVVVLGFAVAFL